MTSVEADGALEHAAAANVSSTQSSGAFSKTNRLSTIISCVGLACFVIAITVRNSRFYPAVLADEYLYSRFTRKIPFGDALLPNYLYFALYRSTDLCGTNYLNCARGINAVLFAVMVVGIFLVARKICSHRASLLLAAVALVSPLNTYTAYFMPEVMYFAAFWLLSWYLLRLDATSSARQWVFAGVLLGLAALVKPHALFLLPAVGLYAAWVGRDGLKQAIRNGMSSLLLVSVGTFVVKLGLGMVLAGRAGFTVFGTFYNNTASGVADGSESGFDLVKSQAGRAANVGLGHVQAVSVLIGLPLVVALCVLWGNKGRVSKTVVEDDFRTKCAALGVATLSSLLGVTVLYTAATGGNGFDSLGRLHLRYYSFVFPLLTIVAASVFEEQLAVAKTKGASAFRPSGVFRAVVTVPVIVCVVWVGFTRMHSYQLGVIDSPELRSVLRKSTLVPIVALVTVCALCLFLAKAEDGLRAYFLFAFPVVLLISVLMANKEVEGYKHLNRFHRAGLITKDRLTAKELDDLTLVGPFDLSIFRALMAIDDREVDFELGPLTKTLDLSTLKTKRRHILLFGTYKVTGPVNVLQAGDGYRLIVR